MKITGGWIDCKATQRIFDVLGSAGYQTLFVGGCVRNAVLGVPVEDIDIATEAKPETVMDLVKAAGLAVVPTGIDHGTVTVISGQVLHQVTTFRKDIETFGRHAVVSYSTEIDEDARRRDFTMNAIYATSNGTVIDPLGGLVDLKTRRVRFVGDPGQRICEDYLRILRFFRFHAWYGDVSAGLDANGLAAVAEHAEGMQGLSQERIGAEMIKLLSAPDPAPAIAAMRSAGILQAILPGANDQMLAPLVHLEHQVGASAAAIRRLAVLGGQEVAARLRLSKLQYRHLDLLRNEASSTTGGAELGYRFGVEAGRDILMLRSALLEHPLGPTMQSDLERGAAAKFPVRAQDLMPEYSGPPLGQRLKELEAHWIASGFTLSRDALLG